MKADRGGLTAALEAAGAKIIGGKVRCPFHHDKRPSGGIHEHNGVWWSTCQVCDWSQGKRTGDIIDVTRRHHDCNFNGAMEWLGLSNWGAPAATAVSAVPDARNSDGPTRGIRQSETDAPSPPEGDSRPGSAAFPTAEALAATLGERPGGTWFYENTDGSPAMAVVRINTPKPDDPNDKEFRPLHPVDGGWAIGDPPGKLPLYGLRELATADLDVVVEGERCVEVAWSIGVTATTSAQGASAPGKTDWTRLAGRDVVVLPDSDKPGRSYAESVARILTGLNPPARVKIVELPGLPEKGDIVHYVDVRECVEPDEIRRGIEALADAASWYTPTDKAPPTDSLPADAGPLWFTIAELGAQPGYGDGPQPITTGYACLDDALRGGFRPECMYTLAARTGSGKTTLALNIARRIALSGHTVLLLKLEERPREALWRIHSAASQVDFRLLLDGAARATNDDQQKLLDGWSLIRSLPIRLSGCRDLGGIQRIACAHVEQGGQIIVVDQLSMIAVEEAEIGYAQATAASNALRLLAVELRIPIMLVCQVNRPAAKKDEEHLSCHDLRDSGAIENDSVVVVLIDKVKQLDHAWRAAEPVHHLDIIVGKNRYGPTTDPEKPLTLTWYPQCCRIEEAQAPPGVEGTA